MSDRPPPVSPLAGTRYCRAVRRRAAVPGARLRVRHVDGVAVLHTRRHPVTAGPARRSRLPATVVVLATLALCGAVAALLGAPRPAPQRRVDGCPVAGSQTVSSAGRTLRLRIEPPQGGNSLLHLCVDDPAGTVERWVVTSGRGHTDVAVQAVGRRQALAVLPMSAGRTGGVTVRIETAAGASSRFAVD